MRHAPITLCITPIAGLVRYPDGPELLAMGGIRFLSWRSLTENWAEHGFRNNPAEVMQAYGLDALEPRDVVAVSTSTKAAKDAVDHAVESVSRAVKLLLACNPAWGPGGTESRPIVGMSSGRRFGFVYGEEKADPSNRSIAGGSMGPSHEIKFDGFWYSNRDVGFYDELNMLLSPTTTTTLRWMERLLDSTLLLGRARLATRCWEAFLFSLIGIERLLKKRRNETWNSGVPMRVTALFSWLSRGSRRRYDDAIGSLYPLRNTVAHEGGVELVRRRDAALADEMLSNLLLLAYKHLNEAQSLGELARLGALHGEQSWSGLKATALPAAVAVISTADPGE